MTSQTKTSRMSFTLVEILIVITIVGILAAALIPKLVTLESRARDVKNKADLRTIGAALVLYKSDNGDYPTGMMLTSEFDTMGKFPLVGNYMTSLPYDERMKKTPTYLGMQKDILFAGSP
jgi:general secretion pathway protein G